MADKFSAEAFFEKIVQKIIWFFLPFYAIYRLGSELFREIFSSEKK